VAVSALNLVGQHPRVHWLERVIPTAALVMTAAAMLAAGAVERGNRPYTANFTTTADHAFGVAVFCIGVLGAVLLGLRPGHRTGWIMLGSILLVSIALLCHAAAVRWQLVNRTPGWAPDLVTWLATWLTVVGTGALPFALATWPTGRVESRWLRTLVVPAIGGLALVTAAQALQPDHLDGVKGARIPNPYGIDALEPAAGYLTAIGVGALAIFGAAAAADAVVRAWRARGAQRMQLYPVAAAILVVALAVLAGVFGGNPVFALVLATPIAGLGLVGAAWGTRRLERAERARTELVAEREAERLRLRRDLHDGVGPLLAALRLELDASDPRTTGRARTLLAEALGEIRRISRDLRPRALDELGLVGAIQQHIEVLQASGGPRMTLHSGPIPLLPTAVEVAAMRITAEALTNVVRHASASNVDVWLEPNADDLVLRIADDGTGVGDSSEGTGLRSMHSRATELGGRCQLHSSGTGTTIEAVLPLRLS
jgi:signal transduction histidine kinase